MRMKGKLIKWNADKAFGFIAPNGGGNDVFIHIKAFVNRERQPQINDVITFAISRDVQKRSCAVQATFAGEKLQNKANSRVNMFSIYLAATFLATIILAAVFKQFPQNLVFGYFCFSILTFISYAIDKEKAKRGAWRIPESTLHLLSFLGGWPGAVLGQQLLRHKSKKQPFRTIFWLSVITNISALGWLMTRQELLAFY